MLADRAGRLEDRVKKIKVKVFPYDDVDVEKGLNLLAQNKIDINRPFIVRYKIKTEKYIQIINWTKHQKPHHTERSSEIPPINPPIKDKENGDGECSSHELELKNRSLTVKDIKQAFNRVWDRYPSKVGRKAAYRHFEVSFKNAVDNSPNAVDNLWISIDNALKNYLASERVKKGYIQNGSTWFNNWQDWIKPPETKPKTKLQEFHEKVGVR